MSYAIIYGVRDLWESVQHVSTAIALISFIFACAVTVYKLYIDRQARLIEVANDDRRAQLVSNALEFFHVNTSGLTRDQRYNIAMEQIRARSARFRLGMIFLFSVSALSFALMAYALSEPSLSMAVINGDCNVYGSAGDIVCNNK